MTLLDTSGAFCIHHADEPQHPEAVVLFRAATRLLTHSYVLAELVALGASRGVARPKTLDFIAALLVDPWVDVVWVDPSLNAEAMALLRSHADKTFSLCDAVSFVLMRRHHIREALTTDHHFEQAGFIRLLRPA